MADDLISTQHKSAEQVAQFLAGRQFARGVAAKSQFGKDLAKTGGLFAGETLRTSPISPTKGDPAYGFKVDAIDGDKKLTGDGAQFRIHHDEKKNETSAQVRVSKDGTGFTANYPVNIENGKIKIDATGGQFYNDEGKRMPANPAAAGMANQVLDAAKAAGGGELLIHQGQDGKVKIGENTTPSKGLQTPTMQT